MGPTGGGASAVAGTGTAQYRQPYQDKRKDMIQVKLRRPVDSITKQDQCATKKTLRPSMLMEILHYNTGEREREREYHGSG